MARHSLNQSVALVTGASSGIGREIALQLAQQGARLLLTARREEKLRRLAEEITAAGGEARVLAGDITGADHRRALIETATRELGGLDLLINNAGVGGVGTFADSSPGRLRAIFEINFFAAVELIRLSLPLLHASGRGMIVNISSVLGHRGVPGKSEYCASKFALHGFSDALRAELAGEGIDVLLVSPSTTASEFWDHLLESGSAAKPARGMTAATVARHAIRAIKAGKQEVILSAGGKLLVWLDRISPPLANWAIARFG